MGCKLYLSEAVFEKSPLYDCSLTSIYDLCVAEARWDEGIEKEREGGLPAKMEV